MNGNSADQPLEVLADKYEAFGLTIDKGFVLQGLQILLILIVGLIAIKIILLISRKLLKRTRLDEALHSFIITAMKVMLIFILLAVILAALKIPTVPIVTVLGATGAAVALALKTNLANVASGLVILGAGHFLKGEIIEVEQVTGVVHSIDLFFTTIHTYDNKMVTVPNSLLTEKVVINHSREETRRVDLIISVGYETDINKALEIVHEVSASCPYTISENGITAGVAAHGESSIDLDLKVWVKKEDYVSAKYFLLENIKLAFDEMNINIPYPQMDIHIKKK